MFVYMVYVLDKEGRKLYPAPHSSGGYELQYSKVGAIAFTSRVQAEIFIVDMGPQTSDAQIEEVPYIPK